MNTLQSVLNGASQDRTKDVIPLRPSQFTSPSGGGKLVRALNRGGNPLDRLAQSGGAALMGAIRSLPREEQIPEGQPLYNNRQVINRTIEPLSPHLDSIGTYELGILRKGETNDMGPSTVKVRDFRTVRDQPCNTVTPVYWNWHMAQRQYEMYEQQPDEYATLTAQDLWHREWSIDGLMAECNARGEPGRGALSNGVLGERKDATVIGKGPQQCYNYWAESGDALQPGSPLFAIIKRQRVPSHYVLANRFSSVADGYSVERELSHVTQNDADTPFRPFQMCFLALPPDSAYPSMRDLHYVDEDGRSHWDSLVIYIGRAHFVPRRSYVTNLLRPSHTVLPEHRELKPYSDANVGVSSSDLTMLTIIMNSDDGICPV